MNFQIPYTSLDDIPLEEYKNLHKQYWTFIAENHLDRKPPITDVNGDLLLFPTKCFACEYSLRTTGKCCCLKIYGPIDPCLRDRGPYYLWWNADFQDERDKLALKIANLEWED